MKQKKENRIALLLQWAGEQKIWLLLAILLAMASGLCIIVPYIGIYRLMDAAFQHICTKELVVQTVMMISVLISPVRRSFNVPRGTFARCSATMQRTLNKAP